MGTAVLLKESLGRQEPSSSGADVRLAYLGTPGHAPAGSLVFIVRERERVPGGRHFPTAARPRAVETDRRKQKQAAGSLAACHLCLDFNNGCWATVLHGFVRLPYHAQSAPSWLEMLDRKSVELEAARDRARDASGKSERGRALL